MRIRPAVAAVIVGAAVMATPAVATAAYPGSNGRIVFEQGGFIYSIRQDGVRPSAADGGHSQS